MSQPKQKRILSLIDSYPSTYGGEFDAGSVRDNARRTDIALASRPGHWFLIGENGKGSVQATGARTSDVRSRGYEAVELNGRHYARIAHPSGVSIEALVTKLPYTKPTDRLPVLARDFAWSRDELNDALATARAWLFPIEGNQAA